jgi:hypothetical protein
VTQEHGAAQQEDTQVWIGRVAEGREGEHAKFLKWLRSSEAHDIFRRRRITEYTLAEDRGDVTIVFKAPHTGDPRLIIDFLRYPGLWPEFWEFVRGGRAQDVPLPEGLEQRAKVHWRRGEEAS